MENQHTENLLRRFKGKRVNIKTISGGPYAGRIDEITNDYVSLIQRATAGAPPVFLFFTALESLVVNEESESAIDLDPCNASC